MAQALGLALTYLTLVIGQSIVPTSTLTCNSLDALAFYYDSTKYECEQCPNNQINDPTSNPLYA